MGIIAWIVLGAFSGFVAGKIVEGRGRGLLVNIFVGLIGALVGGFIVSGVGGEGITGFNIWSVVVSVFGAVILLFILNGFSRTASRK
jgi:uncharacterized membrane protein YeaQ/YmgE (transglycosylase-associated protein family)